MEPQKFPAHYRNPLRTIVTKNTEGYTESQQTEELWKALQTRLSKLSNHKILAFTVRPHAQYKSLLVSNHFENPASQVYADLTRHLSKRNGVDSVLLSIETEYDGRYADAPRKLHDRLHVHGLVILSADFTTKQLKHLLGKAKKVINSNELRAIDVKEQFRRKDTLLQPMKIDGGWITYMWKHNNKPLKGYSANAKRWAGSRHIRSITKKLCEESREHMKEPRITNQPYASGVQSITENSNGYDYKTSKQKAPHGLAARIITLKKDQKERGMITFPVINGYAA